MKKDECRMKNGLQPPRHRNAFLHFAFSILPWAMVCVIRLYRWALSPALVFLFGAAGRCRFTPSCSEYALEAVRRHGALRGAWLATVRLGRCHPWGGCGHDPVPEGRSEQCEVTGQLSEVGRQGSEVGSRMPEDGGRRAGFRNPKSEIRNRETVLEPLC